MQALDRLRGGTRFEGFELDLQAGDLHPSAGKNLLVWPM